MRSIEALRSDIKTVPKKAIAITAISTLGLGGALLGGLNNLDREDKICRESRNIDAEYAYKDNYQCIIDNGVYKLGDNPLEREAEGAGFLLLGIGSAIGLIYGADKMSFTREPAADAATTTQS